MITLHILSMVLFYGLAYGFSCIYYYTNGNKPTVVNYMALGMSLSSALVYYLLIYHCLLLLFPGT